MTQQQAGTGFVGRDRELRELLDALEEAASRRGRLILLGGEPGIGKSRLADELATPARGRGYQVLWGRGWEDAGAPPYWPWVQALRAHVRSSEAEEVSRQLGSGAADVALMLPELRELIPDHPLGPTSAVAVPIACGAATGRIAVATQEPLDLVLEGSLEHPLGACAGDHLERVGDDRAGAQRRSWSVIPCHRGVPPFRELLAHRKGTPCPHPVRPVLSAAPFPHTMTLARTCSVVRLDARWELQTLAPLGDA